MDDNKDYLQTLIPEQRPGESIGAYAAFQLYLSMGPRRDLREVAAQTDYTENTVYAYSSEFQWRARIAEYLNGMRKYNQQLAMEKREELFGRQYDLLENALDLEKAMRKNIVIDDNTSMVQYQKLLNLIWQMARDVRNSDTARIEIETKPALDPNPNRPWEGKVDHESIMAIAARLDKIDEAKRAGDDNKDS